MALQGKRECPGCGESLAGTHGRRKWCGEECRKRTMYSGSCLKCGAETSGSNGPNKAPKYCQGCSNRVKKGTWTPETVIAAMKAWNEKHGEQPRSTQWADCQDKGPKHPTTSTVLNIFGSWNAAIKAAGFTPRKPGRYDTPVGTPSARQSAGGRTYPSTRKPTRRKSSKRKSRAITRKPPPTVRDPNIRFGTEPESFWGETDFDDDHSTNTPAQNRARVGRFKANKK